MKKSLTILVIALLAAAQLQAQLEPGAGNWKTWFITSGKDYRLQAPASYKNEVSEVIAKQKALDAEGMEQIRYWNAGAPGYRWQEMMSGIWVGDTSVNGVLAALLLGTATYDATIAAWDTKYAYKRPRPFVADSKIKIHALKPESPSYPCEHSVAAGVAVVIFSKYYPKLKDSVMRMAQRQMDSRIAAGVAFPSDTRAGFELGKKIAEAEIERTKDMVYTGGWDGQRPTGPGIYNAKFVMFPTVKNNKTVVLTSASQFRPGPPPDFAKDMEELRKFKQTFRSTGNAFYFAYTAPGTSHIDLLTKKLFEHNLHLNPPRAARIYAATAVASYDAFVSCWDAKYTYWGARPDQYDTTYKPLMATPPFPGYPSGHAMMGGVFAEVYSYFFPAEKASFDKRAKDGAESRFQAGIHFRSDNEVGLSMGRKVGNAVVERLKNDGADNR